MTMDEFQLIQNYLKAYSNHPNRDDVVIGIGDDSAILHPANHHAIAVSSDTMIEGVHFFTDTPADVVGYRSLAGSVSDLLAMGALPCWASLALSMPQADAKWLQTFCEGFYSFLEKTGMQLIGGDLCRASIALTWQVIGQLNGEHRLTRSGAEIGDYVAVTQQLGGAAAYCQSRLGHISLPYTVVCQVEPYWSHPQLPLQLASQIAPYCHAAIDISDGLISDLQHILTASGVGGEIWADCLPIPSVITEYLSSDQAFDLALCGGEDYQLCVILSPETYRQYKQAWPGLTVVGQVTDDPQLYVKRSSQGELLNLPQSSGYCHFNHHSHKT